MKKLILSLSVLSRGLLFAHPGHPAPEAHGDLTHLLVGLLIALPLLAGGALLALRNRSKAATEINKEKTDG